MHSIGSLVRGTYQGATLFKPRAIRTPRFLYLPISSPRVVSPIVRRSRASVTCRDQHQQRPYHVASMPDTPPPASGDPCRNGENGTGNGNGVDATKPGSSSAEAAQAVRDGPENPEEEEEEPAEPALPPLSPHEFKQYNRLAEHMNYFHEHFRQTWTTLHNAASTGRRPAGMSLKQYLDEGLAFISHLTTHHNIEESYIFPVLARKMPEFHPGGKGKKAAELLQQHRDIHRGMDEMEAYLRRCRNREVELEMAVMKTKMDSWGEVLWKHLDQEVKTLGADNVRKYFTIEEVRRIPM